jgi:hypothetical protein
VHTQQGAISARKEPFFVWGHDTDVLVLEMTTWREPMFNLFHFRQHPRNFCTYEWVKLVYTQRNSTVINEKKEIFCETKPMYCVVRRVEKEFRNRLHNIIVKTHYVQAFLHTICILKPY